MFKKANKYQHTSIDRNTPYTLAQLKSLQRYKLMGVKLIKQFFFDVEVIILMDVSGERLRYACYIGFAGSDIYTYDICFEGSLGADLEWCFSEYMAITKETKDIDEAESKGNGG